MAPGAGLLSPGLVQNTHNANLWVEEARAPRNDCPPSDTSPDTPAGANAQAAVRLQVWAAVLKDLQLAHNPPPLSWVQVAAFSAASAAARSSRRGCSAAKKMLGETQSFLDNLAQRGLLGATVAVNAAALCMKRCVWEGGR